VPDRGRLEDTDLFDPYQYQDINDPELLQELYRMLELY
jgi:hypothetical protein